jgi:general secretion pathway protein C
MVVLVFAHSKKPLLQFLKMSFLEKFQPLLTRLKLNTSRPPLEKYYVLFLAIFIGYILSDLGLLYVRPMMLPTEAPPLRPQRDLRTRTQSLADYQTIFDRNIFNEDGKIAPALSSDKGGDDSGTRPAVLSQLPIELLGTIVHFNPKLSIATVNLKNKNVSMSYKVDEEIEAMAKVIKIERKKLTFMNLNNRRLEYVEIPEDALLQFGLQASSAPQSTGLIEQRGKFEFSMKRSDFEEQTKNLSSLLQQARMEPVFAPDGIGVEGFRFVNIQPGSIYEKLGFKMGDMIRSVNGEAVNSPTKAMEMYNLLKTSNNVQLGVEREGREERFNYSIQ